jgi:hypothetical protein
MKHAASQPRHSIDRIGATAAVARTSDNLDGAAWEAERGRTLPRLLPLWPDQIADTSLAGRRRIMALMQRALRAERCRGRAGHWTYDLARHAALHRAYTRERAALKLLDRSSPLQRPNRP